MELDAAAAGQTEGPWTPGGQAGREEAPAWDRPQGQSQTGLTALKGRLERAS